MWANYGDLRRGHLKFGLVKQSPKVPWMQVEDGLGMIYLVICPDGFIYMLAMRLLSGEILWQPSCSLQVRRVFLMPRRAVGSRLAEQGILTHCRRGGVATLKLFQSIVFTIHIL